MPRSLKDVLAGVVFVVAGLAFALGALEYDIGSPARMGPGFMPLGLGLILAVIGSFIVARGLRDGEEGEIGGVPWRAIVLIVAAVMVFGLTVRGLGLLPASFATAVLAALAGRQVNAIGIALISVGLTAISMLVFVVALSLRLPLFGPWLRLFGS